MAKKNNRFIIIIIVAILLFVILFLLPPPSQERNLRLNVEYRTTDGKTGFLASGKPFAIIESIQNIKEIKIHPILTNLGETTLFNAGITSIFPDFVNESINNIIALEIPAKTEFDFANPDGWINITPLIGTTKLMRVGVQYVFTDEDGLLKEEGRQAERRIEIRPDICIDNTEWGQCSQNHPDFCDSGILVERSDLCGCPEGYSKLGNSCELIECSQGLILNQCAGNKPRYCSDIQNPYNLTGGTGTGGNGTSPGGTSGGDILSARFFDAQGNLIQPLAIGFLIDDCNKCGCPLDPLTGSPAICRQSTGKCQFQRIVADFEVGLG